MVPKPYIKFRPAERTLRDLALVLVAPFVFLNCSTASEDPYVDTGLAGLNLDSLSPKVIVPGTRIVLSGTSFVPGDIGATSLRLTGRLSEGDRSGGETVDFLLAAEFVDYQTVAVRWNDPSFASRLPDSGLPFVGTASLEVVSMIDGATYRSNPKDVSLSFRPFLEPRIDFVQTGFVHTNDPIVVEGAGFLLGGEEGETVVLLEGCFEATRETCVPVEAVELVATPETVFDRTRALFAFEPRIAGIRPGRFLGTLTVENRHKLAVSRVPAQGVTSVSYDLVKPAVHALIPNKVSLGQYVDVHGGGFVGSQDGGVEAITTLELEGEFQLTNEPDSNGVAFTLLPEFVSGPHVRYVINEDDTLGRTADLRRGSGVLTGRIRPVTQYRSDTVAGAWRSVELQLTGVKQVVWLNFLPSYVESLRHFGLRALDQRIRARIFSVLARDYDGVHIEFREESPDDFALFSQVDVAGRDPNQLGLLGYDNTPGKDVENERLYDKIGGVNATTQEDGFPGYGGIFVESFFGFSKHPGKFATSVTAADSVFDTVFDSFRPDRGGAPAHAADFFEGAFPESADGAGCPAAGGDRATQLGCAVWSIGSMIGTTVTHEIGHSLGLANPFGSGFHNPGDKPNRIMDAGSGRGFAERAELLGEGPAVFCDEAYAYLRRILPNDQPAPKIVRPTCE